MRYFAFAWAWMFWAIPLATTCGWWTQPALGRAARFATGDRSVCTVCRSICAELQRRNCLDAAQTRSSQRDGGQL
jgi:hypothetical protein